MLMAIEVEFKRRTNGALRVRASMGNMYRYDAYDHALDADDNARAAFRRIRSDLLAKGLMDEKLVWDAARLADGGYAFVARMYPAGEEV